MSVSFAPGITAPLVSVTDPESEALTSCPKLCWFMANRNIPRRTAQRYVLALQTLPRIRSPFDLHAGSRRTLSCFRLDRCEQMHIRRQNQYALKSWKTGPVTAFIWGRSTPPLVGQTPVLVFIWSLD